MRKGQTFIFSVLVYEEGVHFLFHCPEIDAVVTADDTDQVQEAKGELIGTRVGIACPRNNLKRHYNIVSRELRDTDLYCSETTEHRFDIVGGDILPNTKIESWIIATTCIGSSDNNILPGF